MPTQFTDRDFTNQFISTSYQDVVQRYTTTSSVTYFLDGVGNVITAIPTNSLGQTLLTQDQTASYALQSVSSTIADVALLADTASIAISSSYAVTSSFALSAPTSPTASDFKITFSEVQGPCLVTVGQICHAEGLNTTASGIYTHAEGVNTNASGSGSHAEGYFNLAQGIGSHAEGSATIANGFYSHAEGASCTTNGNVSHAEGLSNLALGDYSHVEGTDNNSNGTSSHAEGFLTNANGNYSHAEGTITTTNADYSHAEGTNTVANNEAAHAEGYFTTAGGSGSHAEGYNTIASGKYSHAEGSSSVAFGTASHAQGQNTIASGSFQNVVGQFNSKGNTTALFIVGNGGNDTNRSDLALFNSQSIVFNQGLTASLQGTASYAVTASFALNAGGSGTSLQTGSTYPITASWSNNSNTASYTNGRTNRLIFSQPFETASLSSTTTQAFSYVAPATLLTVNGDVIESDFIVRTDSDDGGAYEFFVSGTSIYQSSTSNLDGGRFLHFIMSRIDSGSLNVFVQDFANGFAGVSSVSFNLTSSWDFKMNITGDVSNRQVIVSFVKGVYQPWNG